MNDIHTKLAGIAKQPHAILPTPVHELLALSGMSPCRVFCKRDALTGFGFGGNKARKLDYLMAEASQGDCNTLVAVGANQSNFCRTRACDEAVRLFSQRCGLFLDYVYTGKGAAGLLHYLRTNRFAPNSSILFVHTGGAVELLA